MQSHSCNDQIIFTLSLITIKSFVTILVYINIGRLRPFLREFLLIVCVISQHRPAANAHNNGFIYHH